MEATRATQRPWVAHGAAIAFEAKDCEYRLATMETVPELERVANAALAVRAVNCHDDLLAAVKGLLMINGEQIPSNDPHATPTERRVFDAARAAIAKATGG